MPTGLSEEEAPLAQLRAYIRTAGRPEKDITDERLAAAWESLPARYRFLLRVSLPGGENPPMTTSEIARQQSLTKSGAYEAIKHAKSALRKAYARSNPAILRRAEEDAERKRVSSQLKSFFGGDRKATAIVNCLAARQIRTVEAVAGMSRRRLLSIRGLGDTYCDRIDEKLREAGYQGLSD